MTLEDEDEDELLDGKYEITASRATFQHIYLANITVQVEAMDEINAKLKSVNFKGENFTSPISYSFLYLQWEANKVWGIKLSFILDRDLELMYFSVSAHCCRTETQCVPDVWDSSAHLLPSHCRHPSLLFRYGTFKGTKVITTAT